MSDEHTPGGGTEPSPPVSPPFQSIRWDAEERKLVILDQTVLPDREIHRRLATPGQVWQAIRSMQVRGAPAIGIAAAYAMVLGIDDIESKPLRGIDRQLHELADYLATARPTAVNLMWALDRMNRTVQASRDLPIEQIRERLERAAKSIHEEDRQLCAAIGGHGASLVPKGARILTHCNTGGLATAAFGTAISVIWHAHAAGRLEHVWIDETRPRLQGAKLTAWELQKYDIPGTLIADSAAGTLMAQGKVDMVVVGADRIVANGDTANKIGTYTLACLCKHHGIPFHVAAPYSTFDPGTPTGSQIEIEERDEQEITHVGTTRIAPKGTRAYNPAFDVTPGSLITSFITDRGVLSPPYAFSKAGIGTPGV